MGFQYVHSLSLEKLVTKGDETNCALRRPYGLKS